jgi:hypothetical protein
VPAQEAGPARRLPGDSDDALPITRRLLQLPPIPDPPSRFLLLTLAAQRRAGDGFGPFEAGQGTVTGSLRNWLADLGILDPWASAQIYFVDAGRVPAGSPGWPVRDPRVPAGLLNLEYWFFYQYN